MNHFDLDKRLKEEQHNQPPVSDYVRSRLEDSYSSILGASEQKKSDAPKKRAGWKRRSLSSAAAVIVLSTGLFASGFVSPVMADSIRQIPLVGSLFSSLEVDLGLKNAANEGLTSKVDGVVSYKDIKLEIQETVYDGSRAVYAMTVSAPNLKEGVYDTGSKKIKLSDAVEDIRFQKKGENSKEEAGFGQFWGGGQAKPNTLIYEHNIADSDSSFPDNFIAEVEIKLQGVDQALKLDVPFKKNTNDIRLVKEAAVRAAGDLKFTVNEVKVTPITTSLNYTMELTSANKLTEKEQHDLIYTNIAVYDDRGQLLERLSGSGATEGNRLLYEVSYASVNSDRKFLILKPFHNNDGEIPDTVEEDKFVEGLEVRIDLPEK